MYISLILHLVLDQKRIPLIVEERLATAKLKKSEILKLKRQISRKNSELHKVRVTKNIMYLMMVVITICS